MADANTGLSSEEIEMALMKLRGALPVAVTTTQFSKEYLEQEIRASLEELRKGTPHYEAHLNCLRTHLDVLGCGAEKFKSSNKELEELRVRGCKYAVRAFFDALLDADELQRHRWMECLYEELEKGELTLEECGIDSKEFEVRTGQSAA